MRAIRAAIPSARVTRRFQVVLNGLTVELPYRRLPQLSELPFAAQLYPSMRYRMALNRSPGLIGATAFTAATGITGAGIKLAVVDDGVDHLNPFFNPSGFAYPSGFPKGQRSFTTPKVIAARSYPGPGSGARGRLPLDRLASFHGTHVAGIAAGNSGTSSLRAGVTIRRPPACPGSRHGRGSATTRCSTSRPDRSHRRHAGDRRRVRSRGARRHGRHQLLRRGAATEPRTDAVARTVANVANAGVVPVISAGNDRDEFGLGTVGSPGTAPDAITVAATTNAHVYAPALSVRDAGAPPEVRQIAFKATGDAVPPGWGTSDRTLVDIGSIRGTNGQPVDSRLCGLGRNPNAGRNPSPAVRPRAQSP